MEQRALYPILYLLYALLYLLPCGYQRDETYDVAFVANGSTSGGNIRGLLGVATIGGYCGAGRNDLRSYAYGYGCYGVGWNARCKGRNDGNSQSYMQYCNSIYCSASSFGLGQWDLYRCRDSLACNASAYIAVCGGATLSMDNAKGCREDRCKFDDFVLFVAGIVGSYNG